ncbi:MAG: hypothetical protein H7124_18360 [Phycisphaerales bacterium]|nr:hypothetical protein [Hyphomonadaceae bacterium]
MKDFLIAVAAASVMIAGAVSAQSQPDAVPAPPIEAPAADTANPPAASPSQTEAQAAANADAMAASPASPESDLTATSAPASASAVCAPRVTIVEFGARASALSQDNSNALERAVDAASVCSLQQVVISAGGQGRLASRRADAARATLVRQGVPAGAISVSAEAPVNAAQVVVTMNFAGVAGANPDAAATPDAPLTAPETEANEAEPTPGS